MTPRAPRIAVVTDSTGDLDPGEAAAAGITIVPARIQLGNDALLARDPESRERYRLPSDPADGEAQPLIDAFAGVFRDLLRNHDAAIAILLSERLGAVCAAARSARAQLAEPDRVSIVDSRSVSLGLGLQALRVAAMARSDMTLDDLAAAAENARSHYHVVFSIESIEHLRRKGRIGRAAAMISEALQLKPLLRIDEGQIVPYERARTRAGAIAELTAFVADLSGLSDIAVLYASDPGDADVLARDIAAVSGMPLANIRIARIGPGIAAHVGPGALGVVVVEESA